MQQIEKFRSFLKFAFSQRCKANFNHIANRYVHGDEYHVSLIVFSRYSTSSWYVCNMSFGHIADRKLSLLLIYIQQIITTLREPSCSETTFERYSQKHCRPKELNTYVARLYMKDLVDDWANRPALIHWLVFDRKIHTFISKYSSVVFRTTQRQDGQLVVFKQRQAGNVVARRRPRGSEDHLQCQ